MRRVKTLMMGATAALSLVGASSASAANWDPQNTAFTASQVGTGTFTFAGGGSWSCASAGMSLTAHGDVAQVLGTFNPIVFGPCVVQPGGGTWVATVIGTWRFTATSTTTVNLTATNASGPVLALHLALGCTVTVPSPLNIPDNEWDGATHTLTINSAASFPAHTNSPLCAGSVGTSGTWNAKFALPSNVAIT